eukprot:Colp12_sorted_trinity150504_noHs@23049
MNMLLKAVLATLFIVSASALVVGKSDESSVKLAALPPPPGGYYGFSVPSDRDVAITNKCGLYQRLPMSTGTYSDLCKSVRLNCIGVCDWQGSIGSGCDDQADPVRIAYCDQRETPKCPVGVFKDQYNPPRIAECSNNGKCVDGQCVCNTYFIGKACESFGGV